MDLEKYLSSGIIEDYCLGVLSPEETQEVAKNAKQFPEIEDAIREIEEVLKEYTTNLDND
jgi:anti-sigma-K factor RskA